MESGPLFRQGGQSCTRSRHGGITKEYFGRYPDLRLMFGILHDTVALTWDGMLVR